LIAAALVGGLLVGVTSYSGVWPPIVVVESSSMMHSTESLPYGRFGTINPGDMIFVKKIDTSANGGRGDIWLLGQPGAPSNYGKTGDVLIYFPDGNRGVTPIIHRAIAYVTVDGTGPDRTYDVLYPSLAGMRPIHFNSSGITLGNVQLYNYQPTHGGYITKGDNPITNPSTDQPNLAQEPTLVNWVEGKAVGEIPWFGLIKLALGSDLKNSPDVDPQAVNWVRVGNVYAPADLWVMLGCSIMAIVLVPLTWDVWRTARERRREEAAFEPVVARRPTVRPLARPPTAPTRGRLPSGDPLSARARAVAKFEVVARNAGSAAGPRSNGP
jgi:signal peptidase